MRTFLFPRQGILLACSDTMSFCLQDVSTTVVLPTTICLMTVRITADLPTT